MLNRTELFVDKTLPLMCLMALDSCHDFNLVVARNLRLDAILVMFTFVCHLFVRFEFKTIRGVKQYAQVLWFQ